MLALVMLMQLPLNMEEYGGDWIDSVDSDSLVISYDYYFPYHYKGYIFIENESGGQDTLYIPPLDPPSETENGETNGTDR